MVNGNIDLDNSEILYHAVCTGGVDTYTYTAKSATFLHKFIPTGSNNGRPRMHLEPSNEDIFVDLNADFMIEVDEMDLQDYSSIYKIDIVRSLGEVIKRQIKLEKDMELAYFLKLSENDMKQYGAYHKVDLSDYAYQGGSGDYSPSGMQDLFKNIVVPISSMYSRIRVNYGEYPKYIVTGKKTADLLRNLQTYAVQFANMSGTLGMDVGVGGTLNKMKILEGHSIGDDRMYFSTKTNNNSLERSTIVDVVFHPMWSTSEVSNGNAVTYIRSRTSIEVLRTDGMGFMEVKGLNKYFF